jgi:imidazolonepropionase-like amidohydrolase
MAVALRAARLFDGRTEALVRNAIVIVDGARIEAVGAGTPVPAGAEVIDLGDVTLCPGFIDAHTHLSFEATGNFDQSFVVRFRRQVTEQAYYAATYAKRTLEAGFTTVRDVGTLMGFDFIDVGLRNAISAGLVPGPRMLVAVHLIGATGGHSDLTAGLRFSATGSEPDYSEGVADGPAAIRRAVRFNVKYGADLIKFCASGGVLSLADEVDVPQLSFDEVAALVDEAHRLRKRVAVHCHGDQAAREAIEAGVDSIEHGCFIKDDTLALMKERGTFFVPTLIATEVVGRAADRLPPEVGAKARAALKARTQTFQSALRIGVTIAYGTDSGVFPHGLNAREFGLMIALGMRPIAALRAATSVNAELLGISSLAGTLEAGKGADIVALPGNPLEDISVTERPVFVMKEGRVAKRPAAP